MARSRRFISPGRLIDARPAVAEERARIVHWEGDLIVGRSSRSAIGTLVDRRTGYLRLVHLPDGNAAERLRMARLPVLTDLPAQARQTLTLGAAMTLILTWIESLHQTRRGTTWDQG